MLQHHQLLPMPLLFPTLYYYCLFPVASISSATSYPTVVSNSLPLLPIPNCFYIISYFLCHCCFQLSTITPYSQFPTLYHYCLFPVASISTATSYPTVASNSLPLLPIPSCFYIISYFLSHCCFQLSTITAYSQLLQHHQLLPIPLLFPTLYHYSLFSVASTSISYPHYCCHIPSLFFYLRYILSTITSSPYHCFHIPLSFPYPHCCFHIPTITAMSLLLPNSQLLPSPTVASISPSYA